MKLESAYRICEAIQRTCGRNGNDHGVARNLETFNYVYNYLGNWASEAEIGTDVREQIAMLNEAINKLYAQTGDLCVVIQEYVNSQLRANGQSEISPMQIVG